AGCILYEMLTGRRPFPGESPAEIMYNVLHHQFASPRSLRPELPAGIDHIISRCLARDINERFNSFQELNDALQTVQETPETLSLSVPSRTVDTSTVERKYVTALCYRLDNNSRNVRAMPDLASRVCQQYGGFLLHAATDEGAILLGYPVAEEHAGEKAVRCGLRLLQEAAEIGCSIALGAHAGFLLSNTGQPANRDRLGDEHPVRSAAALCNSAEVDTLLINERLLKQVQDKFEVTQLGNAFSVLSRGEMPNQFADNHAARMTPLSGRFHELGILLDAWERVVDGEGQIISISGEPGIGKSRMVFELKKAATEHGAAGLVECLCAPYQRNTALHPVVSYLETLLQWHTHKDADARQARVRTFADERGLSDEQCSLLQLLMKTGSAIPGMAGEAIRQETLLLIKSILLYPAGTAPLMLIFEDLHWADPTTIDLLNLLIEKGPTTQVLLLCTYRPNFQPRWHGRAHIANLSLNRLSHRDTKHMAKGLLTGRGLAPELVENVVQRTDGVPLFIEELTQTVLERLSEHSSEDSHENPRGGQADIIPLTLQESLQARLDALGNAKHLAQLGSVIGREFSFTLLHAFANPVNDKEFEKQLDTLVRSQLAHQLGAPPDANYRFKHALIRDAAYQSLTVENRRQLHRTVAQTFLESFPQLAEDQPEVLAQHFAEAGNKLQSAHHWLRAGQSALQRYAIVEASSHCQNGIEQIKSLEPTADILQLELALQTTLGPALMAIKGYADHDVNGAYSRAREICHLLGDPPAVFPVLFGLWTFQCVRAQHRAAAGLAQQMVDIAATGSDAGLKVEAHMVRGITRFYRGQFVQAAEDFQLGLSLYKEDMAQQHILEYGQDPGMVIPAYQAINYWLLGEDDTADQKASQAISHGRRSEHPFTLAYGLDFAAWHYINRGNIDTAITLLDESIALCESNKIQIFLAFALVLRAVATVQQCSRAYSVERSMESNVESNVESSVEKSNRQNKMESGIADLQQSITNYTATGAELFTPGWYAVIGQCQTVRDDMRQANLEISKAQTAASASDEQWCLAEIERTAGEIAAIQGDVKKAAAHFRRAIDIAVEQNAVPWKARAQASLAKLNNL
ncbi:MAG: AAA family ATPase, partial [Gammaproteobacteria bacterium]